MDLLLPFLWVGICACDRMGGEVGAQADLRNGRCAGPVRGEGDLGYMAGFFRYSATERPKIHSAPFDKSRSGGL